MKAWKKAKALLMLAAAFMAAAGGIPSMASDFKTGYNTNASDNDHIFTTKSPKGNIGKSMSISFRVRATDEDMDNLKVSLLETTEFQQIESKRWKATIQLITIHLKLWKPPLWGKM